MSSVEKLLDLAEDWADLARRYGVCADTDRAYDRLKDALATTLAEKDARIAELEAALNERPMPGTDAFNVMARMDAKDDDRRRFVDECAMRLYAQEFAREDAAGHHKAGMATWCFDVAEILATERDRRVQG